MNKTQTFENDLQQLTEVIHKMEQPDIGLEESLKLYEQGVQLTRKCQKTIDEAEKKIEQLMDKNS